MHVQELGSFQRLLVDSDPAEVAAGLPAALEATAAVRTRKVNLAKGV